MATGYRFEAYARGGDGSGVVSAISRDGRPVATTTAERRGHVFETRDAAGGLVCSGRPRRRVFTHKHDVLDGSGTVAFTVVTKYAWQQTIEFPDGTSWQLAGPINEPQWSVTDGSGATVLSSTPTDEQRGRWNAMSAIATCEPDVPLSVVVGIVETHRLAVRARPNAAQSDLSMRTISEQ